MTQVAEKMLGQILELPMHERIEVAVKAIESVTGKPAPTLSPEWMGEIRERIEDLPEGNADSMPADEFMKQMRAQ